MEPLGPTPTNTEDLLAVLTVLESLSSRLRHNRPISPVYRLALDRCVGVVRGMMRDVRAAEWEEDCDAWGKDAGDEGTASTSAIAAGADEINDGWLTQTLDEDWCPPYEEYGGGVEDGGAWLEEGSEGGKVVDEEGGEEGDGVEGDGKGDEGEEVVEDEEGEGEENEEEYEGYFYPVGGSEGEDAGAGVSDEDMEEEVLGW